MGLFFEQSFARLRERLALCVRSLLWMLFLMKLHARGYFSALCKRCLCTLIVNAFQSSSDLEIVL